MWPDIQVTSGMLTTQYPPEGSKPHFPSRDFLQEIFTGAGEHFEDHVLWRIWS